MSILKRYNPHVYSNYSYQELLTVKAAGKEVPSHWLTQAYADEQAEHEHTRIQAAIADDLQAREDAHADHIKAKQDKHLPTLRELLDELDALCDAEAPARDAARDAVAAYLKASQSTVAKYSEIARLVRDEFGPVTMDSDGNPLPGQTGLDNTRQPLIEGERIRGVARREPWGDKIFQHPYFY